MKRAVLIIVILAVLVMAGGVQAGKTATTTVFSAERAADALRQAADYLDETDIVPVDVEVFNPPAGQDALWLVVVTE